MADEPTAEQRAAVEVFVSGRDLALVAGAGTGKTTALILMGAATGRRGLYVAFNRAIADDAGRRFGKNVKCSTAHRLAFHAVGRPYQERVQEKKRIPAKDVARMLRITRDVPINSHRIKVAHQARLVMGMISRFCYTADRQVMARHMEQVNGLDTPAQEYLARMLLPYAERAWEDICSPRGDLPFAHDHYLKMWAMSKPVLHAEFVMLDEAQDTNPVLEEVFLAQDAQRVCVGDPAQQIYGWRGARDVMSGFPAEHLQLTQSFRFGQRIAQVANRWLRHAESDMRLTGRGTGTCRVGRVAHPDAVLCRGNADAMQEVMAFLDAGVPVALTGGGDGLHRIATAAQELKSGKRTSHPELFLFRTWGEVQDYVDNDKSGQDLKAIVKLVDKYGPDQIIQAVDRLSAETAAKVTVSTAHKAKGREWASIRIGKGFTAPPLDHLGRQQALHPAEARLIYVAVSRARHDLDPEGIAWIDEYEETADGTVAGRPMIDLNLTRQLRHSASPVSQFMSEHLPDVHVLARDYHACLETLPQPVQPIDVHRPNWSALGHTIDYKIRLSFGTDLGPGVAHGVEALNGRYRISGAPAERVRRAVYAAGRQLLEVVDVYLDDPGRWGDEAMTRLCFVASFFEAIYRSGAVEPHSMLAAATPSTRLADLTAAVPAYVVDDIGGQLRLAEEPLAPFRALPSAAKVCGPVFAGSSDIGGADADYILDGLLLDCKATRDPRRLGHEEIYQLAGYLLLDYDDEYGIDQVGLYLSRQGGLISWSVAEFLDKLGATVPLPQLREQLRDHLWTSRRSTGLL
jgi:hypothetical protein